MHASVDEQPQDLFAAIGSHCQEHSLQCSHLLLQFKKDLLNSKDYTITRLCICSYIYEEASVIFIYMNIGYSFQASQ